jgi:hypothetical protein
VAGGGGGGRQKRVGVLIKRANLLKGAVQGSYGFAENTDGQDIDETVLHHIDSATL